MGTCKEPKINAGTNDKPIKSPIWFSKFSSLWCTPITLIGEFLFVLLTPTRFNHSDSYRANSNRFIENAKSKAGGLNEQKKFGFLFLIVATLQIGLVSNIAAQEKQLNFFSWGADIRLRHEQIENSYLTDADPPGFGYSFERYRIREWNTFTPSNEFQFNIRFTWEGRHYWTPASKDEWDKSDIVLDNLNGKFRFKEIPVTLIVGRQDILFGDGWLVSDGTPLDGPRTTYFEAIRTTFDLPKIKSTLDIIYIDQTSSPDRRIPPIFSKRKPLMEQDERGIIAYFENKSYEHTPIDAYFIYKSDKAVLPNGDDGDVYTFGSCYLNSFNNNISFRIEGAYQFGHRKNNVMLSGHGSSLSAWGQNSRLTYNFHDFTKNQIWLGYESLSGHDAQDAQNKQFDPLWGRWAKYSELIPNDLDRPSDRGNFHRINIGYQIEPASGLLIQTNYNAFFAYANRFAGIAGFSNNGKFKGHLFTALLKYQYNSNWSGLVLGEYFLPGNYYETPSGDSPLHTRDNPAAFLRIHLLYTF